MSPTRAVRLSILACFAASAFAFVHFDAVAQERTEILTTFKGHTAGVYAVAFTPDNKFLVTGSLDNTVALWDTVTGKLFKQFGGPTGHQKMVLSVAVSPDGTMVASGSGDTTLKIWDVPVNAPVKTYPTPDPVRRLALSPDGLKVALAYAGGKIAIATVADMKETAKFDGPPAASLAWTANGTGLVAGGEDGSIRMIGIAKNETTIVGGHRGIVKQVVVAGGNIQSIGSDGTLRTWTMAASVPKTPQPLATPIVAGTFVGDSVLVASADRNVRLVQLTKDKEKTFAGATADVIAVATNGVAVAALQSDGWLSFWTAADGKLLGQIDAAKAVTIAVNPQANQFAAVGADGVVRFRPLPPPKGKTGNDLVDTATSTIEVGSPTSTLHFSPQGTQMATGGADKKLRIWDLAKKAAIHTLDAKDAIRTIMFSPDGKQVAAAAEKNVLVWTVADGKEVASLVHPALVRSLAWSQNGQRLVSGCDDKQARVWELPSGRELQHATFAEPVQLVSTDGGATHVTGIAGKTIRVEPILAQKSIDVPGVTDLTLFGNTLYTTSTDKNVKAWSQALTPEKITFPPPPADAGLQTVAVAKNQLLLATGGDDKTVRVYQMPEFRQLGSWAVEAPIARLGFTSNSQFLIATLADGKVVALTSNFTNGQPPPADFLKPAQTFAPKTPFADAIALNDGASLLAGSADKAVTQWKIASSAPIRSFQNNEAVLAIAFPPKESNIVAAGCRDGRIRLWDVAKNTPIKVHNPHVDAKGQTNSIYSIAYSPDGTKIATASFDRSVKIVDAASGNVITEMKAFHEKDAPKGHFEEVFSVAWSPDGKLIASGSGGVEKVIKLWKADDGSFVRDLVHPDWTRGKGPAQSHPGIIHNLRFLADGRLLAVGDAPRNEGYLSLWDTRDGRLLVSEALPFGTVYGFAITSDEKLFAIGAGSRGNRTSGDMNQAYLLKVPNR